jgi:hypothetical protein
MKLLNEDNLEHYCSILQNLAKFLIILMFLIQKNVYMYIFLLD